jgi:hypothetical protein
MGGEQGEVKFGGLGGRYIAENMWEVVSAFGKLVVTRLYVFYPAEQILRATARPSHQPTGRPVDQLASFFGGPASQGDEIFVRTTDQIFAR